MVMKQRCSSDKSSKGKLFVIRALGVSKDNGKCELICPGSAMRSQLFKGEAALTEKELSG